MNQNYYTLSLLQFKNFNYHQKVEDNTLNQYKKIIHQYNMFITDTFFKYFIMNACQEKVYWIRIHNNKNDEELFLTLFNNCIILICSSDRMIIH